MSEFIQATITSCASAVLKNTDQQLAVSVPRAPDLDLVTETTTHLLSSIHVRKDFIPVLAIDGVSISWCVDHSEAELHSSLFDLYRRRLDLNRSFYLFCSRETSTLNVRMQLNLCFHVKKLCFQQVDWVRVFVLPAAPGMILSG